MALTCPLRGDEYFQQQNYISPQYSPLVEDKVTLLREDLKIQFYRFVFEMRSGCIGSTLIIFSYTHVF